MTFAKRILLKEGDSPSTSIRVLSGSVTVDAVTLSVVSGTPSKSIITITRTGNFTDSRYGSFSITRDMLLSFVRNFETRAFGQDIAIDVAHKPENGAAGYIRRLFVDGVKLRAEVEWTPLGLTSVKERGYRYLSAEYSEDFVDNEQGKTHGPTLLGAALVVRPCIKNLDRVELAEVSVGAGPTVIAERLALEIIRENQFMKKQKLLALAQKMKSMQLSESVQGTLMTLAERQVETLQEESAIDAVLAGIADSALALKDVQTATVQVTGLTRDDVTKMLAEQRQEQDRTAQAVRDQQSAVDAAFDAVVDLAKHLSEATRAALKTERKFLSGSTTAEQATNIAGLQVQLAEKKEAHDRLVQLGIDAPLGSVQVIDNAVKPIQAIVHEKLRRSVAFANRQIQLAEKVSPFVEKVLSAFDATHAARLVQEHKVLAGESTISDSTLPVAFQREVIREALSDLNILQLVQTLSDPGATATTNIPYEQRDVSGVVTDGFVYERQPIPKVKARQFMDLAYIAPTKIAFEVSNEAMHFTRASAINWDAWAANLSTASRYMRELIHRRIANEMQRVADAYLAVAVASENIQSQLTGANSRIKTAQFPIVRPHQRRDLQGTAVGSAENPITLVINSVTINPYDGTGTQAAATYYTVENYNLGYIRLVNQLGVSVTPASTPATITYSRATNIVKVDADLPANTKLEAHMNTLLQAVGRRKAVMLAERYIKPDFQLMSTLLNDSATNADTFVTSLKRDGTSTTGDGDLSAVKGIPAYSSDAPGIDLGEERILMGQKGTLSYTVAKPFQLSEMQEARNVNGQMIGAKEVYGEEYSAIHVPLPIRDRFTSVLFYSFTQR